MDHSKDVNTDLLASYFRRTTDVRPSDTRPPRDRPKPKNNALLQFVQQRKRCTTPKCPNVVSAGQTMCSECAADPGRLRDTIVGARLRHAAYDLMLDRLHKKCEECVGGCSESHQEDIQRCTAYTCPIYSETHFARQQRDTWRTQVDSTETLDKIKRGLPKQGLDTTFTEVPGRDWTQIVPADLVDDLRDLAF